jgi:penicillin G amidase
MQKATVDSMRIMQMDNYSMLAQDVLPTMLKYLDPSKMDKDQLKAFDIIKSWDKHYEANSIGASIFDNWWNNFYNRVWQDKFDVKGLYLKYPSYDRTEKLLLTEPDSKWFDNPATTAKETCADIVAHSFHDAVNQLAHKNGAPGDKWQWGLIKETFINHLANLPGFGTGDFVAGGRGMVINALRFNNGPSWRMVVQMGPQVKGYGVFPGGESGNPGSYYYEDMFNTWEDGKLNELLFLGSENVKSDQIKSTLILNKSK